MRHAIFITTHIIAFIELHFSWLQSKNDWISGDPSLPQGWRLRHVEGIRLGRSRTKCYILSPDGQTFQSRVKALRHLLVQEPVLEEVVGKMREVLEIEGWTKHPLLPSSEWRVRQHANKPLQLLTPAAQVMGLSAALSHVVSEKSSNGDEVYSEVDNENMMAMARGLNAVKEEEKVLTGWAHSSSLPLGWSVKKIGAREYFLTPSGEQLKGVLGVIKHLLRVGATLEDEDVMQMRSRLFKKGWEEAENLPLGWLVKRSSRSGMSQFLSADYRQFCGMQRVYHHLRAQPSTSQQVLAGLRQQLSLKARLSNRKCVTGGKEGERWRQEEGLPDGWKVNRRELKYKQRAKETFLSPDGIQLPLAVLAVQLMVEEGKCGAELEAMLPRLEDEGWREDSRLPDGWRIHINPENVLSQLDMSQDEEALFLSSSAEILGLKDALQQLKEEEQFTEENLAGLRMLVKRLQRGEMKNPEWVSDRKLPKQWKLWRENLGFKVQVHVITSDGRQYDSLLEAFTSMATNRRKHSMAEMESMLGLLEEEGWEREETLPIGWLISRHRGDSLFQLLSREGLVFQTLYEAQEWMEEKGKEEYPGSELVALEQLCLAEVEAYLSTRNTTFSDLDSSA